MSTLLDIAKANGVEQVLNEAARVHPELTALPVFNLRGLAVKSVVYTGASNTHGSFRVANAGTAEITEDSEERTFQCYTAEPRIEEDVTVADRFEEGPVSWMEGKAARILDLELLAWCRQMYYGAGNNPLGFPGLIQTHDAANMVIDAGGATEDTGSSVWLVRAAPHNDLKHEGVRWRMGVYGKMVFDPIQKLPTIDPADGTKKLMKYHTAFTAFPGFQVQSLRTVVRIKGLTEDAGHGLTDALMSRALRKFPIGRGPTDIFMTLRSNNQLRSGRTATTPTGEPAPWPDAVRGINGQMIPIHLTEAISDAEPLTL